MIFVLPSFPNQLSHRLAPLELSKIVRLLPRPACNKNQKLFCFQSNGNAAF
jgi:hypothetical protein